MKRHLDKSSSLVDFWNECQAIYHTVMRDRAARRQSAAAWMHHRARLALVERRRNPAMTRAFREAGFAS